MITHGLPISGVSKTSPAKEPIPAGAPLLDVNATVIFGGLEVSTDQRRNSLKISGFRAPNVGYGRRVMRGWSTAVDGWSVTFGPSRPYRLAR